MDELGASAADGDIGAAIVEWHDREWVDVRTGAPKTAEQVALKVAEETGEVAGAVIKLGERRTGADWLTEARKELGDLLITASVLAARLAALDDTGREWTLDAVRGERWDSVQHRRSADYRTGNDTAN